MVELITVLLWLPTATMPNQSYFQVALAAVPNQSCGQLL
jgi:hypothetical protein